MPVSGVHVTAAQRVQDTANDLVVSSFSLTASRLALVTVVNSTFSDATPNTPTLTGHGTWVPIASYEARTPASASTQMRRITMWGLLTGAGSTATLTVSNLNNGRYVGVIVDEFDGADIATDVATAIVQSKTAPSDQNVSSLAITLDSSVTAGNATYGCFWQHGNPAGDTTEGTDFTKLGEQSVNNGGNQLSEYWASPTDAVVDVSFSITEDAGGIAVEIKAAAAAGVPIAAKSYYYNTGGSAPQ